MGVAQPAYGCEQCEYMEVGFGEGSSCPLCEAPMESRAFAVDCPGAPICSGVDCSEIWWGMHFFETMKEADEYARHPGQLRLFA